MSLQNIISKIFNKGQYVKAVNEFNNLIRQKDRAKDAEWYQAKYYLGIITQYNLDEKHGESVARKRDATARFTEAFADGSGYLAAGIELAKMSEPAQAKVIYDRIASKAESDIAAQDKEVWLYARYKKYKIALEQEGDVEGESLANSIAELEGIEAYIPRNGEGEPQLKYKNIADKVKFIKAEYIFKSNPTDIRPIEMLEVLAQEGVGFSSHARRKIAWDLATDMRFERARALFKGNDEAKGEAIEALDYLADVNNVYSEDVVAKANKKIVKYTKKKNAELYETIKSATTPVSEEIRTTISEAMLSKFINEATKLKSIDPGGRGEYNLMLAEAYRAGYIVVGNDGRYFFNANQLLEDVPAGTDKEELKSKLDQLAMNVILEPDNIKKATDLVPTKSFMASFDRGLGAIVDKTAALVSKATADGLSGLWSRVINLVSDDKPELFEEAAESPAVSPRVAVAAPLGSVRDRVVNALDDKVKAVIASEQFRALLKSSFVSQRGILSGVAKKISNSILNSPFDISTLDEEVREEFLSMRADSEGGGVAAEVIAVAGAGVGAGGTTVQYTYLDVIAFCVENDIDATAAIQSQMRELVVDIASIDQLLPSARGEVVSRVAAVETPVVAMAADAAPIAEAVVTRSVTPLVLEDRESADALANLEAIIKEASGLFRDEYKAQLRVIKSGVPIDPDGSREGVVSRVASVGGIAATAMALGPLAAGAAGLLREGVRYAGGALDRGNSMVYAGVFVNFGKWDGDVTGSTSDAVTLFRRFLSQSLAKEFFFQLAHISGEASQKRVAKQIIENVKKGLQNGNIASRFTASITSGMGGGDISEASLLLKLQDAFQIGLEETYRVSGDDVATDLLQAPLGRGWKANEIFTKSGKYRSDGLYAIEGFSLPSKYGFSYSEGDLSERYTECSQVNSDLEAKTRSAYNSQLFRSLDEALMSGVVQEDMDKKTSRIRARNIRGAAELAKAGTGVIVAAVAIATVAFPPLALISVPYGVSAALGGAVAALACVFCTNAMATYRKIRHEIKILNAELKKPPIYTREVGAITDQKDMLIHHGRGRKLAVKKKVEEEGGKVKRDGAGLKAHKVRRKPDNTTRQL